MAINLYLVGVCGHMVKMNFMGLGNKVLLTV